MRVIEYFKILTTLITFFFKNFPDQNGKVLEERLAGPNSDVVKTTLRGIPYFKTLLLSQVLEKPLLIPPSLCYG